MKLLLEMLGMTSQCNMKCSYCDWQKDKFLLMNDEQLEKAYKYLDKVRQMVDYYYSDIGIVQYSGGEPLLYPAVLFYVLKIFHDKWIRINTNGVLITDEILDKVKVHGKTYFAVSLDGVTLNANEPRFADDEKLFKKVMNNIDKVISREIPLMILCTLNKQNIDEFPEFVETLSRKYSDAIDRGMLVMPTHAVTSYSKDNGAASQLQVQRFRNYISQSMHKYKILNNISLHYQNLVSYLMTGQRKYECSIFNWSLSVHFRKNQLIEEGKFLSFGCGMRGVHELGLFKADDENSMKDLEQKVHNYQKSRHEGEFQIKGQVSEYNQLNEKCENKCFPDWVIFDLIFTGQISIEEAKKWFVIFRDSQIEKMIQKYREVV